MTPTKPNAYQIEPGASGAILGTLAGVAQWITPAVFDLLTFTLAEARYVNISGDTMVGTLIHPLAPTASGHVANRLYVDSLSPHIFFMGVL